MQRIGVLALIWGWSFLLIKVAVDGMTPTTVAAGRITLGAIVMLGAVRARGLRMPRDIAAWRHFAVMGTLASFVPFTLLAFGEERITSALTSVLNASTPLFAAIAAAVLLQERLKRSQIVGLAIGLAGVAIASGIAGRDVGSSTILGAAAAVGAAACYGYTFVYARRNITGTPPLVAAAGQLVCGAIVSLPLAALTTARNGIDPAPHRLLAVAILGIVGTGVAYVLYYGAIADLGPTKASIVTYLVPVVAVTVGVVFLSEPFKLRILAGGGLTILGIGLLHERLRRRPASPVGAEG
ncbi:MAG: DMT family transporter [Acidimicrobiales bacterium]